MVNQLCISHSSGGWVYKIKTLANRVLLVWYLLRVTYWFTPLVKGLGNSSLLCLLQTLSKWPNLYHHFVG